MNDLQEGAVFIKDGPYKNKVGFYSSQNEQLSDMDKVHNCPDCQLSSGNITKVSSNIEEGEKKLDTAIPIETGFFCKKHQQEMQDNERAIIYWDKPYGENCSLIHPYLIVNIPSIQYQRYKNKCKESVQEALKQLQKSLKK